MSKKVFTDYFLEPLGGAATASVDINTVDGNLKIDALPGGSGLASGALQYLENQAAPTHSVTMNGSQATFTLKSGSKGQPWMRLPWAACNGATEWHIHLNPTISLDITAHSGGGNVYLNLAGMNITRLTADTGGGNMEVILPEAVTYRSVTAKTGAGNLVVELPAGTAARIRATSGLGKVILDKRFIQIDKITFQSPDFDQASNKVELNLSSGAGNVSVSERAAQYEAAASRD